MNKVLALALILTGANLHAQQMTREEARAKYLTKPTIEGIRKDHTNACFFYKTADDYYNNNPVKNMEWVPYSYSMILGSEKFEVINNGNKEKVKISESGYDWMSNENGMLMRKFDKDFYIVVLNGPLCYYVQYQYGNVVEHSDGTYYFSSSLSDRKFFDFYSETLKGDVIKWKDKVLDTYLEQFGLMQQYKDEKIKREMRDSVDDYMSKEKNKLVKYLKMVNLKLTKKD
jgi:hypothetical protein